MKFILDRLPPGLRVGTPVIVSAAAVGVSAIVVAFGVGSIGKSLLQPSVDAAQADPLAALTADSSSLLEKSRKRFDGRSMYTLPPMPVRRPKVVETKPVDLPPPPPPGPPPVPASYTGPQPTSVLGEYVFFATLTEDDKRIKVGETKSGITVIAVNAPYSVKLGYQRGEFTVSLWPKVEDRLLKGQVAPWRVSGLSGGGAASGAADGGATRGPDAAAGAAVPGAASGTVRPSGGPSSAAAAAAERIKARAGENAGRRTPTTNPNTEPGAVPPPEGEPGDLPSDAMKPVQLPSPNGTGGAGAGGGGSSESQAGVEFVDRSVLPPRLTQEQIAAMNRSQAQAALDAINATDSLSVDDHSRARLDHERALLQARLNRNP